MANLKRAAALTLSAAMFLQPMTASAVTWGSVMQRNPQPVQRVRPDNT